VSEAPIVASVALVSALLGIGWYAPHIGLGARDQDGRIQPATGRTLAFVCCVALAAVIMAWRYVGFQASDDDHYLAGGLGWLEHFPYVGGSHRTLRHTITLPVAAMVELFGLNEFAVSMSGILYFLGLVALNTFCASRFIGLLPAFTGTLLMVTAPGFVVTATYVNADLVELLYVSTAFWAFVYAIDHPDRRWPLVLAGAAAALGVLTRETAAAFALFLGLLFLFHPMMPRKSYVTIAAGSLAVLGAEWVFLTAMTGNPLYRIGVVEHHDVIDRAAELSRTNARGALIDAEGNVSVSVWLDPILSLFITQKYGLLFWAAIPAAVRLVKDRAAAPASSRVLRLLSTFALVWYAFIVLNPKLYLVPRYLVVTASLTSLLVGWWLTMQWQTGRRALTASVTGVLVGVNLLGLCVTNVNPRFAERELVRVVTTHPGETIYTDPGTKRRAEPFLRFQGLDERTVSSGMPPAHALVLYNEESMARCARTVRCLEVLSSYAPKSTWQEIARIDAPRGLAAEVVEALPLQRLMPRDVRRKITHPVTPVVLYRVPGTVDGRN
jgi:dolichyl-phosphate-mannose-protein mannosyltransferase